MFTTEQMEQLKALFREQRMIIHSDVALLLQPIKDNLADLNKETQALRADLVSLSEKVVTIGLDVIFLKTKTNKIEEKLDQFFYHGIRRCSSRC